MTFSSGVSYTGDFVDGKPNGKGAKAYLDGRIFTGNFIDGKENGKGTKVYPDGRIFTGNFVDGKANGKGTKAYPDGRTYTVFFVDGKGTDTYPHGRESPTIETANITKLAALPQKRNKEQTTPENSLPLKKRRKIIMCNS